MFIGGEVFGNLSTTAGEESTRRRAISHMKGYPIFTGHRSVPSAGLPLYTWRLASGAVPGLQSLEKTGFTWLESLPSSSIILQINERVRTTGIEQSVVYADSLRQVAR